MFVVKRQKRGRGFIHSCNVSIKSKKNCNSFKIDFWLKMTMLKTGLYILPELSLLQHGTVILYLLNLYTGQ